MNACRSAAFAVCCINILATQPRMISSVDWVVRAGSSLRGTGDAGFLETIDWEKMGVDTGETNANFNQCGFPSFAVANSKHQSKLNQAAANLPQPALLTLALARLNDLRQLAIPGSTSSGECYLAFISGLRLTARNPRMTPSILQCNAIRHSAT